MHISYWESLLKIEVEKQQLEERLRKLNAERSKQWLSMRKHLDKKYNATYYFYDSLPRGMRLYIVITGYEGRLENIKIVDNLDAVGLMKNAN